MTPEQKGDELIEKFSAYTFGHFVEWQDIPSRKVENAIQCAIIAVEEIIASYNKLRGYSWNGESKNDPIIFWNSVLTYLKSKTNG